MWLFTGLDSIEFGPTTDPIFSVREKQYKFSQFDIQCNKSTTKSVVNVELAAMFLCDADLWKIMQGGGA